MQRERINAVIQVVSGNSPSFKVSPQSNPTIIFTGNKYILPIFCIFRHIKIKPPSIPAIELDEDIETYYMAKSYFDLKEYDRCNFFTAEMESPKTKFLHYYSAYLSGEKKRLDNMLDTVNSVDTQQMTYLKDLRAELQKMYEKNQLDGYLMYLYGIVLKRMSLMDQAKDALLEAVKLEPFLWGAWLELAHHINDRESLESLNLPNHWVKYMFVAHSYVELHLNQQALEIYFGLQAGGLPNSTYLLAQVRS